MSEIINWLTTTPLGLAAVIGGLVLIFILVAIMSERKTRKLYPDRDRRGTKAAAKAKEKKAAAKNAASATTSQKSATTASKPKKSVADKVEEVDIGETIEGFFDKLWGDEETGEKGLIEKLWDIDDEDEEEAETEKAKSKKAKDSPTPSKK